MPGRASCTSLKLLRGKTELYQVVMVAGGEWGQFERKSPDTGKYVRPAPQLSARNLETQEEVTHRPMNSGSLPAAKRTIINTAH